MRSRYAFAFFTSTTGGSRFGITMARANSRAVAPTTSAIAFPSRRCACQSSGRVIVMDSDIEFVPGTNSDTFLHLHGRLLELVPLAAGAFRGERHAALQRPLRQQRFVYPQR